MLDGQTGTPLRTSAGAGRRAFSSPAVANQTTITLTDTGYALVNFDRSGGWIVPGPASLSIGPQVFRDALSCFASGVCVVTTVAEDGHPAGVTISAFSSLSLQPPLVLFCIGKGSANLNAWLTGGYFAVNVLGEAQEQISETFAQPSDDKFAGVSGTLGSNGCFCIDGCVVILECRRMKIHDEGDHYIVIGLVDRVHFGTESRPLLRFQAGYRQIRS